KSPAALRPVRHRPDPQKRPDRMQREQAHPPGRMDGVLMRMIATFRDEVWDVVDGDDAVEQHHHDEDQQPEREVVQKRITHTWLPLPTHFCFLPSMKLQWNF